MNIYIYKDTYYLLFIISHIKKYGYNRGFVKSN